VLKDETTLSRETDRHEEFVTLLVASHDKLLGYLMSLLASWHDAQDVLQSASLVMWQKFATFESGSDFVAWASTICFYEAKNFQRLTARSPLVFDDDLLEIMATERVTDLGLQESRAAALQQCLKQLRPNDLKILHAAYSQRGQLVQLAESLSKSPRTFYNKLALLRRRLFECVQRRVREGLV
jgi:RNA polymerase sigma-70 factor (ECF subfamily)